MISVRIKTVKPGKLPYNRVGDWHWDGERLEISVQDMKDPKYEWLLALHEICEAYMCLVAGVTEESIDEFDKQHNGEWIPAGPGYREHLAATGIESILASITGVNWDKYEEEVAAYPPPEVLDSKP